MSKLVDQTKAAPVSARSPAAGSTTARTGLSRPRSTAASSTAASNPNPTARPPVGGNFTMTVIPPADPDPQPASADSAETLLASGFSFVHDKEGHAERARVRRFDAALREQDTGRAWPRSTTGKGGKAKGPQVG